MKYLFLFTTVIFTFSKSIAQRHDNVWMIGYHGQGFHPLQNNMIIDFSNNSPVIEGLELQTGMSFGATNTSICNDFGELLFYTNGIYIADETNGIMQNGDSLNNVGITYQYENTGLPMPQACLILPFPEHDSLYCLFHIPIDFVQGLEVNMPFLYKTVVNMNLNNGLGAVVAKNEVVIEDTLSYGKLTACKHANGRDWWILLQEDDEMNNGIYKLLLTPNGISNLGKSEFIYPDLFDVPSVGNAIFTPDGSKYIRHDIRFDPYNSITIYDFDRCTGDLQPLEYFELDDTTFIYGGAAVSPDSRYLYCVTNQIIYQFDLWASDIESTKTLVATYDGYVGLFFRTLFGTPQLAPDGSIWIATVSDTVMHLIRTPIQPGLGSHVAQHAIHLPKVNQKSIPNFPNYRLGPLDGSPCDTLGLDNHPLAGFTWWAEELEATFSDNSYYRPETWAWDFGDFSTSSERNPLHTYALPGEYHVCLIVANEYAADTICHWVTVDTLLDSVSVAVQQETERRLVKVQPNPASSYVMVALSEPIALPATWSLYDQLGREVRSVILSAWQPAMQADVSALPNGLYFWHLHSNGTILGSGKLVVVK